MVESIIPFFKKWYQIRDSLIDIDRKNYRSTYPLNEEKSVLFNESSVDLGRTSYLSISDGFCISMDYKVMFLVESWMETKNSDFSINLIDYYEYFGDDINEERIDELSEMDEVHVVLTYGRKRFIKNHLNFFSKVNSRISEEDIKFLKRVARDF